MQVFVSLRGGYSVEGVCYVGMSRRDLDAIEDTVLFEVTERCDAAMEIWREAQD